MASQMASFYTLPDEIILDILRLLDARDVANLQLASRQLLKICRDNTFWRSRCLIRANLHEQISLHRHGSEWVDEEGIALTGTSGDLHNSNELHSEAIENISLLSSKKRKKEYQRIVANWDPTFPGESISWYQEYIHRNAKASTNWFEKPSVAQSTYGEAIDVRGLALYAPSKVRGELYAVSPLEDGSVCLWDVNGTTKKKGAILSRTSPGFLYTEKRRRSGASRRTIDSGIVECVSVDNDRQVAFFAMEDELVEVDLPSLSIASRMPFEWMIMTLSEANGTVPLTVGTLKGLHLYDYRAGYQQHDAGKESACTVLEPKGPDFSRLFDDSRPLPPYTALAQPGPQSILHLDSPWNPDQISDDIFVAGRFPSILHYDRRMFPSIKGTMHSGAQPCSLTSLPYPFSGVDVDLRRRLQLSQEQVEKSKSAPGGRTVIACGSYKTKGSLEIYGLSSETERDGSTRVSYDCVTKNRVSASQSKLLSVATHGTRIVFSDGQGYLRWMERDGFSEVRRHKIGKSERITQRSIFGTMPGSDDIARKILSTRVKGNDSLKSVDDIIFCTGEALGVVNFSSGQAFSAEDFVEESYTQEEVLEEQKAQRYRDEMRRVLARDADAIWHTQNLGAGSDSIYNGM
ncbi:hypothetical protein GGR57DRAFT_176222 [Xylariaceae sp. FL1272]|nr:hypothetical protein GGR57DRAFT_176222 [Xylariaceae sp. FL1272]